MVREEVENFSLGKMHGHQMCVEPSWHSAGERAKRRLNATHPRASGLGVGWGAFDLENGDCSERDVALQQLN